MSLPDFNSLSYTDEYRRTFAVFTLEPSLYEEYSPNTERLYSPSNAVWNPILHGRVWAALGCAEREVGVGSVRVRMTFLWMSEPLQFFLSALFDPC